MFFCFCLNTKTKIRCSHKLYLVWTTKPTPHQQKTKEKKIYPEQQDNNLHLWTKKKTETETETEKNL